MYYMGETVIELFVMEAKSLVNFLAVVYLNLSLNPLAASLVVAHESFVHSFGLMVG
ncbi:hypothetical protein [Salmonella phage AR2819]|nr:hypothetical protein [Salmonella phage AR2819]